VHKEKICPVKRISLKVPQKTLQRLFYGIKRLTPKKTKELIRRLGEVKKAKEMIAHIESLYERILLKR